jgi:tetratricopeptide (TPR) repeat protein
MRLSAKECLALPALVAVVFCVAAEPQAPRLSPLDLLNQYERGEYESVLTQLDVARDKSPSIGKELVGLSRSWTDAKGAAIAARRRLIAASLELEVVAIGLDDNWSSLRSVLESACELVRREKAVSEGERLWQLAALALSHGSRDLWFLATTQQLDSWLDWHPPGGALGHLDHFRRRFPDEPRGWLGEASLLEFIGFASVRWHNGQKLHFLAPAGGPEVQARLDRAKRLAAQLLGRLANEQSVGPEALLRRGYLLFQLEDFDSALHDLAAARERTNDIFLQYLSYLFIARTLEAQRSFPRAAEAYRMALTVLPGAPSATAGLTSRQLPEGQVAEAFDLVSKMLMRETTRSDPWLLYGYGDFRLWPERIRALRAYLLSGS